MEKVFGIKAEINITTSDNIAKGVGKGLSKGSIALSDLIKDLMPEIKESLRKILLEKQKNESVEQGE